MQLASVLQCFTAVWICGWVILMSGFSPTWVFLLRWSISATARRPDESWLFTSNMQLPCRLMLGDHSWFAASSIRCVRSARRSKYSSSSTSVPSSSKTTYARSSTGKLYNSFPLATNSVREATWISLYPPLFLSVKNIFLRLFSTRPAISVDMECQSSTTGRFPLCKAQCVSTETASKVMAIVLAVEYGLNRQLGCVTTRGFQTWAVLLRRVFIGSRKSDIYGSYGFWLQAQQQTNAGVGQRASRFLYW